MSTTRKIYKSEGGRSTSKGPRPTCVITAIDGAEVVLSCGHRRPKTGREHVGGSRRCELCPNRKARYAAPWHKGRRRG